MKPQLVIFIALALITSSCKQPKEETMPIRKDVLETVFAAGVLEANNTYNLTAQMDGYLQNVSFKEGDRLKTGQVLAKIDNQEDTFNAENAAALYDISVNNTRSNAPLLAQAQTAVNSAKLKLDQDQVQEQRYKRLLESNSIARSEYETALLSYQTSLNNYQSVLQSYKKLKEDAEQQTISTNTQKKIAQLTLSKNAVKAPAGGKVYQKFVQNGDYVRRGDVIATVGDVDFIYAKVNIDESSIAKIKIGQMALVQLNTQKDKSYHAEVWEILPSFDEAQQSFICKLRFIDPLEFRIVKTQLQTNIEVRMQKNALLIPRNYLEPGGFVTVKVNKDEEKKVKITTNFVSTDWVQVLSGIDDKTVLITTKLTKNKLP
jgi:multidrug resistance efflux pump